jgi:hypothetical protein
MDSALLTTAPRDQGQEFEMIKAGQKIEVQVPDYCELTVLRPNGEIEVVRANGFTALNDQRFARIKLETAKAGRGEVLSYRNVTKTAAYTTTEADAATDSTARIEKTMRYGE